MTTETYRTNNLSAIVRDEVQPHVYQVRSGPQTSAQNNALAVGGENRSPSEATTGFMVGGSIVLGSLAVALAVSRAYSGSQHQRARITPPWVPAEVIDQQVAHERAARKGRGTRYGLF